MKHLSNTTKKNIISRIITGHNSRMITVRYFKRKHDMYMYFIHLNVILTYYLNWGSEALNCVDKPNSRIVSSDSNLGKMNGEGGGIPWAQLRKRTTQGSFGPKLFHYIQWF